MKPIGIASTRLFRRNFAVEQVLRAGVWESQTTFTPFYLCHFTYSPWTVLGDVCLCVLSLFLRSYYRALEHRVSTAQAMGHPLPIR